MTHKTFRITIGQPNPKVRWSLWRISVVVSASLLTLFAGVVALSLTQSAAMHLCSLLFNAMGMGHNEGNFLTITLISTVVALIVDVCVVWKGAKLITRFANPAAPQAM